jgi:hypothetical protein
VLGLRPVVLASSKENTMNGTAKKSVAAVAVAAFAIIGFAAPAEAGKAEHKTVWCC